MHGAFGEKKGSGTFFGRCWTTGALVSQCFLTCLPCGVDRKRFLTPFSPGSEKVPDPFFPPFFPDTFGGVCKASSAAEQKRRWRPYGACRRTPKGKPLPRHSPVWRQRRSPRRGRWPKRLLHANREIGVPMIVMHSVGWQHGCQGRLFAAPCFRSRLRKHATGAAFLLRPLHLPESQFKNAVVVRGLYALLLHTAGQQHLRVIRVIPFR